MTNLSIAPINTHIVDAFSSAPTYMKDSENVETPKE
jgi:hypothetical protein